MRNSLKEQLQDFRFYLAFVDTIDCGSPEAVAQLSDEELNTLCGLAGRLTNFKLDSPLCKQVILFRQLLGKE